LPSVSYTPGTVTRQRLFVYGALLDPALLAGTIPDAVFERIAHLPAHRLGFARDGDPVVVADEGHTVWGGVFTVTDAGLAALATEYSDRHPSTAWAVDREGDRFEVVVFSGDDGGRAGEAAVTHMLAGARHWELPTGWVVGLEDLIDPFEF